MAPDSVRAAVAEIRQTRANDWRQTVHAVLGTQRRWSDAEIDVLLARIDALETALARTVGALGDTARSLPDAAGDDRPLTDGVD